MPLHSDGLEDRRRVVDEHGGGFERMVSGAIGRVRDVVARVDPHAVLAFGKRRRVPVELRLRQDFVGLGRFDPASGPLAVKLDVIAKLVAVGIVHFPRHVKHAVVLGGFVSPG